MNEKINLDFFGEVISIPIQKDLPDIRRTISTKFFFTDSDAQEIILYYLKENERKIIVKEEDYKIFLKEKSKNIFLDISQSSQIYKKNLEELKNKELNEELEKLYKKREEYNNIKEIKFEKEIKEIEKIKNEIKKLKMKKKEIKMYIKEQMDKINEEKEQNEKKIKELEIKLHGNKINISPINNKHEKKNKKKESKKLSYFKELENLVEEKKKELEDYANSIKENFQSKKDNNSGNNYINSNPRRNNNNYNNYNSKINYQNNDNDERPIGGGLTEDQMPEEESPTSPCPHCGRNFNPNALSKHAKICEKVFMKKRKAFKTQKQRINDLEQASLMKQGAMEAKRNPLLNKKNNGAIPKWKLQSMAFRVICNPGKNPAPNQMMMNNNRMGMNNKTMGKNNNRMGMNKNMNNMNYDDNGYGMGGGGFVSNAMAYNYKHCEFCNRNYNEEAYNKHLNFCKEKI